MRYLVLGSLGTLGQSFLRQKTTGKLDMVGLSRKDMDFEDTRSLIDYLNLYKPEVVINCVGKVSGVSGNMRYPYDLAFENASTLLSITQACVTSSIPILINFAPTCIFPDNNSYTYSEIDIWSGPPEKTSRSYATAKILGVELINSVRKQFGYNWLTFLPTNLFGSFDWNHFENGHLISMLTSRLLEAKRENYASIEVWGDGTAVRDFLLVDDLVNFVLFCINKEYFVDQSLIPVPGYGEVTIRDLTYKLKNITKFKGDIIFNSDQPSGARRKVLNREKFEKLEFQFTYNLEEALHCYVNEFIRFNNC